MLIVVKDAPADIDSEQVATIGQQGVEISASYYHKKLKNLVIGMNAASVRVGGLINVRTWARHKLSRIDNDFPELRNNNALLEECGQLILSIVRTLVDQIEFDNNLQVEAGSFDKVSSCFRYVAFPDAQERIALARELLDTSIPLVWRDNGILPPQVMRESPPVPGRPFPSNAEGPETKLQQPRKLLFCQVAILGANLALLSLFGNSMDSFPMISATYVHMILLFKAHGCLLRCRHWDHGTWIKKAVTSAVDWPCTEIRESWTLKCFIFDIIECGARLLAHEEVDRSTVVSSGLGQVLYPAFFESTAFVKRGYLHMCVLPGFLSMNGMRFHRLQDGLSPTSNSGSGRTDSNVSKEALEEQGTIVPADFASPHPIHRSINPIHWRIAVYDDVLKGDLLLAGNYSPVCSGFDLITRMSNLVLSPPCEHASDAPAEDLAQHFRFWFAPGPDMFHRQQRLLVTVQRDYGRQLLKLAQGWYHLEGSVVMHVDGCIRCAMQLCLDYDLGGVIS